MEGILSKETFLLAQKLQDDICNDRLPDHAIPQKRKWTILRNEPRAGEKEYQTWHISSPTANASTDLKDKISQIFNNDDFHIACIHDDSSKTSGMLKPIVKQFDLKHVGCDFFFMREHLMVFLDTRSQQTVLLKASRFRGFQLQDLTAAKASSRLNSYNDIRSMITEGLVPTQLESLITKYL